MDGALVDVIAPEWRMFYRLVLGICCRLLICKTWHVCCCRFYEVMVRQRGCCQHG